VREGARLGDGYEWPSGRYVAVPAVSVTRLFEMLRAPVVGRGQRWSWEQMGHPVAGPWGLTKRVWGV